MLINEELKKLLPPLTPDEYKTLEESIVCDGCREPLVVWNDTLVDGHNRYEICTKHNILFDIKEIESDNIEDIKIWIIDNQKGRRNLTDGWKYELAQTRKKIIALQAAENLKLSEGRGAIGEKKPLSIVDKPFISINTQKEIAEELGWSTGKVAMADKVWKDAPEEIKEKIKSGDVSINEAYKGLKKPHVSNNSGENEWYTPEYIIEAARKTMGNIELDPASSKIANQTVKAKKYFDIDSNGLEQKWHGNIWLNPPYSQPLISQYSEKINTEINNFNQACILTNNATETEWYQNILINASVVCFFKSRIKFIDINGNPSGAPLQGQSIIYIGKNSKEFYNEFKKYGICLKRII